MATSYINTGYQTHAKADKVANATNGNFAGLDANGNLIDSGHKHSDYLTSHQDISGKADKVSGATNNNFAGLDANGNLKDSGKKASDFKSVQSVVGDPSASGNSITFIDTISQNEQGVITPTKKTVSTMVGATTSESGSSGLVPQPLVTDKEKFLKGDGSWSEVDLSVKADKVAGATAGDVATLDANGNLVDSGKTLGKSVPADAVFTDTTYSPFSTGSSGLVPAPTSGDGNKVLKGNGTWGVTSIAISVTASAGSWSSATPPTQDVTAAGVTATNSIIVSPSNDITVEQLDALLNAKILCTAQAEDEITLTCYGEEPQVNIPMTVLIVG